VVAARRHGNGVPVLKADVGTREVEEDVVSGGGTTTT
jgi:hypothetical protein